LWLLDEVFRDKDGDPYYESRRDRAVLVGLDCKSPCDEDCFCQDMGSLWPKEGYDLMFSDLGDRFFIDMGTEKGRDVLTRFAAVKPAGPDDFSAKHDFDEEKRASFHKKMPIDVRYLPEMLDQSEDSLVWEAQSRKCMACGQCTLVCPTCYCFDVKDRVDMSLTSGERERRWDSCMIDEFAQVAGGESFREKVADRLKHRLFRKGKYLLERFNKAGCVGCGRCIVTCPAGISILEVYKLIAAAGAIA